MPRKTQEQERLLTTAWTVWLSNSLLPRSRRSLPEGRAEVEGVEKGFVCLPRIFLFKRPLVYSSQKAGYPFSYLWGAASYKAATKQFPIHPSSCTQPQHLPRTSRWIKEKDTPPPHASPEACNVSLHPGKYSSISSTLMLIYGRSTLYARVGVSHGYWVNASKNQTMGVYVWRRCSLRRAELLWNLDLGRSCTPTCPPTVGMRSL